MPLARRSRNATDTHDAASMANFALFDGWVVVETGWWSKHCVEYGAPRNARDLSGGPEFNNAESSALVATVWIARALPPSTVTRPPATADSLKVGAKRCAYPARRADLTLCPLPKMRDIRERSWAS
jgi:hypothetical protein